MTPVARDPEFYLRHADYVRALARHVVFDQHLAEDVEQRVWLAALEHAPNDLKSPRAWLKALVRSFAIKAWRGEARRARREELVSRDRLPVPTPAEILEHENARRQLVEALLELDEPYRSTLTLRFFEGLEASEIARRLDLPLETVRTHQKRGLARLRERLERRNGEFGASLALLFVRTWRLEPPSYTTVGSAVARSLIQGALVVTATHKFVIAAAAIVLIAASWWLWPRGGAAMPQVASNAAEPAPLTPPAQLEQAEPSTQSERAETSAAPASEPTNAAPAVDPRYGSLLLRVIWADDKSPASGVGLRLLQDHADDYYHDTLDVRSGADGTVRIERILAGEIYARIDRGWTGTCRVEPGANAEATIEIPAGHTVTGHVFDFDGRPLAGAEIYLATWGGSYEGFVIARSRDDGSFELRGMRPRSFATVSARAVGRSPTRQHAAIGEPGETTVMRLQFESAGGELTGHVFDTRGLAVANARVMVGSDAITQLTQQPDGSLTKPPASQCTRTNALGEFRFEGLPSGLQPIQVSAKEMAAWKGEVEVVEQHATSLDIRLDAGVTLSGTVRDAAGNAVEGAEVWSNVAVHLATTMCKTDALGAFSMRGQPLGEFVVEVDAGERGYASTTLFGVAGRELRWDAMLSAGARLRVQLVAPGRELAGWNVTAEQQPSGVEAYADTQTTDATGRVEFANVPDVELRLCLREPGAHTFPRAVLRGVRAGVGEVTIQPDPALEPTVHLRGRVVDPAGNPRGGVRVAPENPELFYPPFAVTDADGRFEFGPFPAGEWRIHALATGFARVKTASAQVAAGTTWDFGDVQLVRGGTVAARLAFEGGAGEAQLVVELRDATGVADMLTIDGERAHSSLVPAGHYKLAARCAGFADAEIEVEVVAGSETEVAVPLRKR